MAKHYGHIIIEKVLSMKESGKTKKEIGEELGYTAEQIKEVLKRHRRDARKMASGTPVKKKGRPRKRNELNEKDKDYRIKQLEMENELLRNFLSEFGRR